MAIREKARALFKSKSKGETGSQISKASTKESDTERWPSNVYKPGEAMPRPKYRAPPKKEHKEKLEAFSFAEAWRRKSFQSQYSPMGTRAPSRRNSSRQHSRRNSWYSMGKKSFTGKSDVVRNGSVGSSGEAEKQGTRQREHVGHAAKATTLRTELEQEGDDDVGNGATPDDPPKEAQHANDSAVGLSRVQSKDMPQNKSRPTSVDSKTTQKNEKAQYEGMDKTLATAHDHQPFTEQDLALALSRSHLAVPARS